LQEKSSEAMMANCEELKGSPVLRKLCKDIGGQVRRDSSKNLRQKYLSQQSIFFSQPTDSSVTIRIKRRVKLPVVGPETLAPKSGSKTSQAKNHDLVQSGELA